MKTQEPNSTLSPSLPREAEQILRELGGALPALFWIRDVPSGLLRYANPRWEELLGFPPVLGRPFQQLFGSVHPDDLPHVRDASLRAPEGGFDEKVRLVERSGEVRWYHIRAIPIQDAEGRTYRIAGIGEDISARVEAEETVRSALHEKELLLREIHHRVKNNLQIVSGLLYLQASRIGDPRLSDALQESQNRILSMAMIHQRLSQASTLAAIPFDDYVRDLIGSLLQSYRVGEGRVFFSVDASGLSLDVDTAVPCGLILNELIANSLKHAFPGGRRGSLRVSLRPRPEGGFVLAVEDDGVGLPPDFDERRRGSLGTQLIERLVDQLGGRLTSESHPGRGTRCAIELDSLGESLPAQASSPPPAP